MNFSDFNQFTEKDFILSNVEQYAEQLKDTTVNLPEGRRTPTPEELSAMQQFQAEYRKKKPNASNREVRRAVQRKFNIQLIK